MLSSIKLIVTNNVLRILVFQLTTSNALIVIQPAKLAREPEINVLHAYLICASIQLRILAHQFV